MGGGRGSSDFFQRTIFSLPVGTKKSCSARAEAAPPLVQSKRAYSTKHGVLGLSKKIQISFTMQWNTKVALRQHVIDNTRTDIMKSKQISMTNWIRTEFRRARPGPGKVRQTDSRRRIKGNIRLNHIYDEFYRRKSVKTAWNVQSEHTTPLTDTGAKCHSLHLFKRSRSL